VTACGCIATCPDRWDPSSGGAHVGSLAQLVSIELKHTVVKGGHSCSLLMQTPGHAVAGLVMSNMIVAALTGCE
jgi:hypothetical protein